MLGLTRARPERRADYPVRAVFEELAVSRQREGNVVVSRPFRHLTHVAARDHKDGHKALPQAVERDLRESSPPSRLGR
jgi:hypothetical protein